MKKENIIVPAIIALLVSLAFGFISYTSSTPAQLGGRVETVLSTFSGGIQVSDKNGTAGTALKLIKSGTCTILANVSIAATSSKNFDCTFTGARSGDIVLAHPIASSTVAAQYAITGYNASTTNDTITFTVLNLTGVAAVPAATVGFGSSTQVTLLRPQ